MKPKKKSKIMRQYGEVAHGTFRTVKPGEIYGPDSVIIDNLSGMTTDMIQKIVKEKK